MLIRVAVEPSLLKWACERARMDVAALSERFPSLPEWINQKAQPTLRQLEAFSKATHAPIGCLFLQKPPFERVPIPDFRAIRVEALRRPSPDLLDTIHVCQQRQEWYREHARVTGEQPAPFVGSVARDADIVKVAAKIRDMMAFNLKERRDMRTWTDARRRFIEQADNLGVLVMVNGVVGSNNRRKLDPTEFRGFALSDDLAPLVFINGADTKAGQMFTLAHELAHLWLGESALTDVEPRSAPTNVVENWCNRVAAELLVPLEVVRQEHTRGEPLRPAMDRLARRFKVSTLVILRRIHDAGALSRDRLWREYDAELQRLGTMPKSFGGSFYLTAAARVSRRFARAVVTSTWEGRASFSEASHLLGFKKMSTFRELGKTLGVGI